MPAPARLPRPEGVLTRGTTNPNRLRRVDRWLVGARGGVLRHAGTHPLVVDLGYGRHPVTVLELAARVRRTRPDALIVGVEIDPQRVAAARACAPAGCGVTFEVGGFELGPLAGRQVHVLRAFNVLRQYPVERVGAAWDTMCARLAPGGIAIDGTCDEIGRLASWVELGPEGPRRLVLSWRLAGLSTPAAVAARLPKALIDRNVAPFRIHALLAGLDEQWRRAAGLAAFGARQRFAAACQALAAEGWPLRGAPRWRQGTVEVDWAAVSG